MQFWRRINMQNHQMAFTRREAADALRVSLRTLDYLLAHGTICARRIGRRVVIPRDEIIKLLRPVAQHSPVSTGTSLGTEDSK